MENICQTDPIHFLTDFWTEKYLMEYIPEGGSKIKFVTGRAGSGKTWFLQRMCGIAERKNFQTVFFSARDVWLHDFKEIYAQIFRQCDILNCLRHCGERIVRNSGYDPDDIPEDSRFIDYLSRIDRNDALTRRDIREQLRKFFLDNPRLDNNFALACSMLTGGILGYPTLEEQSRELLLRWLEGDKTVKLAMLRAFGMSPSRITKYNARHMLRSLAEIARLGGSSGLFIAIDDLDILVDRDPETELRYTKVKREDTYESIRQMVDDIDSMSHILFVLAFDRTLLDDEKYGVKSYQALWMRIQNEVTGQRFNRFADMVDLDRMAAQEYDAGALVRISEQIAARESRLQVLNQERAEAILAQARIGALGMPGLVCQAMRTEAGGESDV